MHVDEAVAAAERELRRMQRPDLPLRLVDRGPGWTRRGWCYAFAFNSVAYLDGGELSAAIPTGALVVPTDGTAPWVLPSAEPTEAALDRYENLRRSG
jgi:hypothetical protein